MPTLVIVESPTKARTISKYLPDGYRVEACMGHVRDLPGSAAEIPPQHKKTAWAKEHGINIEGGFEPLYVVPAAKRKVVTELRRALKDADALVIATDEDREGESIGWHLTQVLKPKVPVSRMVFHEITKTAIQAALENERDIDQNLVRAQETRRILDRLVGYTVSPVLWVKIAPGLSAGRVQSVAVRVLVERERERRAFRSGSYWEVKAKLGKDNSAFQSVMVRLGGKRIAVGRDFDETTGQLKTTAKVELLDEARARGLSERLRSLPWKVASVERKPRAIKPYPPFTTSTLQQEANRKLSLSSSDTMRIAQRLYERGLITYMRTDSVNLSSEAVGAARRCVEGRYGAEYLSKTIRTFTTKSKGAQEAHEAIRPAGEVMPTAEEAGLIGREKAVYDLIWKRTVATQMAEAQQELMSVVAKADEAEFRASGKRLIFAGFLRAYVEGSDDPNAALEDREVILPALDVGDDLECLSTEAFGRETRPAGRFTEAALVEKLEKEGIGRPSTYATIISTIINRKYARKSGNTLIPTFTAFGVTQLMEANFNQFVDVGFTASMEEKLDAVASGATDWLPYLKSFWCGEKGLSGLVATGREHIDPRLACTLNDFADLDARVRIGRYGPYLESEVDEELIRVSIPEDLSPGDLSKERADSLLAQKINGPTPIAEEPDTGEKVFLLVGRYGPYIQLGEGSEDVKPKRVSLPKGLEPDDVTAEKALALLSLPRTLGTHPSDGEPVVAAIGRYGPYVSHGREFRSLTKDDDVLKVELPRALELLAQEKPTGRRGRAPAVLREMGAHPGDGEAIKLMKGRYGAYVTHDGINATIPRDMEPSELSFEDAVTLLAQKALQSPKKKKKKKASASTKRASAKKTPESAKKKKTKTGKSARKSPSSPPS